MNLFSVELGVDKAAKPTGQSMRVTVLAPDRLSAGIEAEELCNGLLPDPSTMYTHAVSVRPINNKIAAAAA